MPSTSKAQHNAMEAAAHGHSTLGIPKKVGQDFAAADAGKPEKKATGGKVKHKMTEHPDHFLVDSDHGPFKVAKAGLHPDTVKQFQKMAEGGEAEEPDDYGDANAHEALDPSYDPNDPNVPDAPPGAPGMGDVKGADASGVDDAEAAQAAAQGQGLTDEVNDTGPRGPLVAGPTIDRQGHPALVGEAARTTARLGATPGTGVDPAADAVMRPKLENVTAPKLQQITDAERADVAAGDTARAQNTATKAAAAGDTQKAEDFRIKAENDLQAETDNRYAAIISQQDDLRQQIADGKIDPNRYWHDKGTGGKIAGAIGILLSGFGAGMQAAGGHSASNMAMQVIQKGIDRDIDAQKTDLHTKESLLADTYRQTGDLRMATAMTRQHLTNVALAMMNKAASVSGQADVQLRNQVASSVAHLSLDQGAREIANSQSIYNTNAGNANKTNRNNLAMAEYGAKLKANADLKTPREMQGAKISNLNATISDLDSHLTNLEGATQGPIAGRIAVASPWGGADAKANSAAADILREKLASALGGGVASDARIHQAIASVPDPRDTPTQAKAKITRIKSLLATQRDEYIREQGGVDFKVAPNSSVPLTGNKPAKPAGF